MNLEGSQILRCMHHRGIDTANIANGKELLWLRALFSDVTFESYRTYGIILAISTNHITQQESCPGGRADDG